MKIYSFDPTTIDNRTRILILGTLPGKISLEKHQYYANPRNQFWLILENIFGQSGGDNYDDKLKFLLDQGLALWDVLESAEREGSSDRNIRHPVPNDFTSLFQTHQGLKALAFNGGDTKRYFDELMPKNQSIYKLEHFYMPSTSPLNTHLTLEQKIAQWSVISQT